MNAITYPPRWSAVRSVLIAAAVVAAVALAGCEELGLDPGQPFETYSFKYALAVPSGQTTYTVTRPDGTACPGVPSNVSLALLVGVIQNRSDFFDAVADCGGTFLVAGNAVREVRNNSLFFDYRVTGNNNDASIRANRIHFTDPAVDPSGMMIQTTAGQTVGSATSLGFAEVYYLDPDRTFRCDNGGPRWSDNVNRARATFFEIRLISQNLSEPRATGEFQCIARNESDHADERLLLIVDGAFSMVIR